LQEASDEGKLAEPGPKVLNYGLLAASLAHVAVLGPWYMGGQYGTWVMPAVLGTWVTALGASLGGLLSKRA
jgi:hypothetical protein